VAISAAPFPSSFSQVKSKVQFTATVLIMAGICFPSLELLLDEPKGYEKHWRAGYCSSDANQLSN